MRHLSLLVLVLSAAGSSAAQETPRKTLLGIYLSSEHGALAGRGVLVLAVVPGSPAEAVGIAAGDVIQRFHGAETKTSDALIAAIQSREPGEEVEVVLLSDGSEKSVRPTLAPWREPAPDTPQVEFPDPLLLSHVEAAFRRVEGLYVARRPELLSGALVDLAALSSFFRSCVHSTLEAKPREDASRALEEFREKAAWYAGLARAGIDLPVNPFDARGNALSRVEELVGELGAPDFDTRERAAAALRQIPELARPYLEGAKDSQDLELRERALSILEGFDSAQEVPPGAGREYEPRCARVGGIEENRIEIGWRRGGPEAGQSPVLAVLVREGKPIGTLWLSELTEDAARLESGEGDACPAPEDEILWLATRLE